MQKFLKEKYGWKVSLNKSGVENQYVLYVQSVSMINLYMVVKPFIVDSMKYKLGSYGSYI
jgi:hypothetical protein